MTQTPGTPAYMPPEVMVAKPKYDTSVDMFSYGIMMIHTFSGQWPEPQVGPSRTGPGGRLIPVTEAERREVFLQEIGNSHQCMSVIKKCIDNDPQRRACATEILGDITSLKPATSLSADPLEMLKLKAEIEQMKEEIKRQENNNSFEKGALQMQIKDADANLKLLKAEKDAKDIELTEIESQSRNKITELENEKDQKKKWYHDSLEKEKRKFQLQLDEERNVITMKEKKISGLLSEVSTLNEEKTRHLEEISTLTESNKRSEAEVTRRDADIRSQQMNLEARNKALKAKGAIISCMSKEVNKAAEYLIDKKQVCIGLCDAKEEIDFSIGN
jgi:serine/threonine protein kinase